jgi:hypothetical protein
MMQIEPEGVGKRVRLSIAGEHYYLIGTRAADGGIDYTPSPVLTKIKQQACNAG